MIKRNFTDASRFRTYEDKIHLSNRKNSTYFLSQKQTLSSKLDEKKNGKIYFFHIRSVVNSFIYNLFSSSSKRRTEFHLFGSRIIFFFSMTRRIKQSTVRETLYRQIVLVLEYFHRSKWEEWRLRDGVNICWFNGLYRILKLPWLLFFCQWSPFHFFSVLSSNVRICRSRAGCLYWRWCGSLLYFLHHRRSADLRSVASIHVTTTRAWFSGFLTPSWRQPTFPPLSLILYHIWASFRSTLKMTKQYEAYVTYVITHFTATYKRWRQCRQMLIFTKWENLAFFVSHLPDAFTLYISNDVPFAYFSRAI